MTKTGFGFITTGVFIYFVATQTQIGWLYLFDASIWSLIVLSAVLPWFSLKSVAIEREVILSRHSRDLSALDGPVENETVEVKLKLTNRGRLARYLVTVVEDCPFEQPEKQRHTFFLPCLRPGSTTGFSYVATGSRRGHYASASATLQSSDPLGLIVRRRTFPLPLNLTVYPAYYPMQSLPTTDAVWSDWGSAIKSRTANEIYGSREYQPGEPLKYVHWRNTARMGRFMLKEFEQAGKGSLAVAFETRDDFGKGRETTLEYSVRIAASLSRLCFNSGRSLDILAGAAPLPGAGWHDAMDFLARLEKGGNETSLAELALSASARTLVLITPAKKARSFLSLDLSQLSQRFNRLVVVLLEGFIPDEKSEEFTARLPSGLSADSPVLRQAGNLEIVHCSPGDLMGAIKKLGNALALAEQIPTG